MKTTAIDGLEDLYTFQEVDVQSIRPMEGGVAPAAKKPVAPPRTAVADAQLPLHFDGRCRLSMDSFVLQEPISRLGLSKYLEASLLSKQMHRIQDVLAIADDALPQDKMVEVRASVGKYLGNVPLYNVDVIDYEAFVRSLFVPIRPLEAACYLRQWELETLIDLQPHDKVELKRLVGDRAKGLSDHVAAYMRGEAVRGAFLETLRRIADVFVRPWMRGRHGLAVTVELNERLAMHAAAPHSVKTIVEMLSATFGLSFLLEKALCHADTGLFASDLDVAETYDMVIDTALSYFYNDSVSYTLDSLVSLISRELAKGWQGMADEGLVKILRLSPKLQVRRGTGDKLFVHLR